MNGFSARCLALILLLGTVFNLSPVQAQNPQPPPTTDDMDRYRRLHPDGKSLGRVAIYISVVTAEDVRRNPTPTITAQISAVPRVMVYNQNPGSKRVNIRGMASSRVVALIDGVK